MRAPNKRYTRLVQQLSHLASEAEDTFNAQELADLVEYIEEVMLPFLADDAWHATLDAERARESR
jgi:hypothetical protein